MLSSPCANPQVRQPQVIEQTLRLSKEVDLLHKVLGDLRQKLSPVVNLQKERTAECRPPDVALVQLADSIRSSSNGVEAAILELQYLISEIEL